MMLFVGSDHAGFELKSKLIDRFKSKLEIKDLGTDSTENVDYPLYAEKVAQEVLKKPESLGLLICGTGEGMCMSANKVKGIRAAVVSEPKSAQMAREHNDAQILCMGGRIMEEEKAAECLDAFLSARFDSSHPRHKRRIDLMSKIEKEGAT